MQQRISKVLFAEATIILSTFILKNKILKALKYIILLNFSKIKNPDIFESNNKVLLLILKMVFIDTFVAERGIKRKFEMFIKARLDDITKSIF